MSYGVVTVHCNALKQNLNTKITIQSEVFAVSEYVPYKIYIVDMFWGQGYALHKKVLYQGNKIAIKVDKNGINP